MEKKYKEYLVFAGFNHYPYGGIEDLFMVSSDLEKIKETIQGSKDDFDWCQIVNRETLKIRMEGERYQSVVDENWKWKWDYRS